MKKFVVLLIVLSLFVFGNQFVFSQESPINIGKSKSGKVETVLRYLHVYPEDLGKFKKNPVNVINEVNRQSLNGHNNWRLPTDEELSLMYANGEMLGLKGRNYMTRENQNDDKEYYVRLVSTNNSIPTKEGSNIDKNVLYRPSRGGGSGTGNGSGSGLGPGEGSGAGTGSGYRSGSGLVPGTGSGSGKGSGVAPGRGGGSGTGSGSGLGSGKGSGSGSGSGLGPGTGGGSGNGSGVGPGGSGGGIGYGTGNRGYTHMPYFTIPETGQVYVEVHVDTEGNVVEARVINNSKYPTTITNPQILADCVASAKTAKYRPGKEELRIIVFK